MKSRKKTNHSPRNKIPLKDTRKSGKTGLPPGSLVHIGKKIADSVTVRHWAFNSSEFSSTAVIDLHELKTSEGVNNWFEICGLHDTTLMGRLGKALNISPLVLEDILNTEHRPKFDIQGGMLFLTLKAFYISGEGEILDEQASFILGSGYLVSFHERSHSWFDSIKAAMEAGNTRIRQRGNDFILYSLLDIIIDRYYAVAESLGDRLEELEELIFENPDRTLIDKNREIKKEIIKLRKALIPSLEAINKLKRGESDLVMKDTLPYFDDIYDHMVQVLDYIDTYREISAELKESYLSNLTLRMNQVMKLLTIITSIFIPLSFIAGIYGMNFRNMPELGWKYGYYTILGIMFLLTVGMLIYFRRKKWL